MGGQDSADWLHSGGRALCDAVGNDTEVQILSKSDKTIKICINPLRKNRIVLIRAISYSAERCSNDTVSMASSPKQHFWAATGPVVQS